MKQINLVNADDTATQLFLECKTYYRQGQFQKVLDTLMRCIKAPKSKEKQELDIACYNKLGIVYGNLGQEVLSKENLLKALKLSKECDSKKNMIQSYVNLGFLHQKLGDLDEALAYEKKALAALADSTEEGGSLHVECLAYQGIIYSKQGQIAESTACLALVKQMLEEWNQQEFRASVANLTLRISLDQGDEEGFSKAFESFLNPMLSQEDFLLNAEIYMDICCFLLEKGRMTELRRVLDYMKEYIRNLPLMYLKHHVLRYELSYAKKMEGEAAQWEAMQNLFAILADYEAEQQNAKLYSFDYIEYMHQEKSLSSKMEEKSKLDPMTGLLNKFTLEFLAEEYFKQKDADAVAAVLVIDMDHFKQVNDTLGHLAGDAILSDTATVIRQFFNADALCGRIGGDEFVIFIKDVKDISTLLLQAEFLRQEISKTTSQRNITIAIQASIGVALTTAGYTNYASLFTAADGALYQAKKDGRNKISVIE